MWMVVDNPEGITAAYMSRFKAKACKRCGREKISLTWSHYIDGPHYDRRHVIRYGCECHYCEESNMTRRRFRTPEEAVNEWNKTNQEIHYIGEGPETKQATISSDIDQVRRKKGWF